MIRDTLQMRSSKVEKPKDETVCVIVKIILAVAGWFINNLLNNISISGIK